MGDYSLSPTEVAALSLSRDGIRPDPAFVVPAEWLSELAEPAESLPDGPRPRISTPETDDQLAAFLELLPEELYSLSHPAPLTMERVVGPDEAGEWPQGRPAQRAAVERLERVLVAAAAERSDRCCSICLEEMEVGGEARALGCSHRYHEACIFEWLRRSSSCPLCRYQLPVG